MKKIMVGGVSILLVVALLFTFTAWNPFLQAPAKTVNKFMKALSAGRFSRAESFLLDGDLGLNIAHFEARRFYKTMFATLDYTVHKTTWSDRYAEVNITVTAADMAGLVVSASLEAMENALSSRFGDRKYFKLLRQKMGSEALYYTTVTVTVYLVQVDGDWKIDLAASTGFVSALTGGVPSLMSP